MAASHSINYERGARVFSLESRNQKPRQVVQPFHHALAVRSVPFVPIVIALLPGWKKGPVHDGKAGGDALELLFIIAANNDRLDPCPLGNLHVPENGHV